MTIMYRVHPPMPPGYRSFQDVVREIAAAEGWTPTGFHFGWEPGAEELERIATVHFSNRHMDFNFPVEALHVRKIESDDPHESWTVFRSAPVWHEA
jgi:hypothetical protein